jgi:L-histidine N-alpha-methyltransferase
MSPRIDVHLDPVTWRAAQIEEACHTLSERPPWLAPWWFYDEVGSDLFDQITRLPEYYPTRAERALLERHAPELADLGIDTVVELGSGTSDKTTVILDALHAAGGLARYVPFDVSEETLRTAAARLAARYRGLEVHGVVGDFHEHLAEVPRGGRRLVAFLGSTIGNLDPGQRATFLADLAATMGAGDRLLLGVDLVKDPSVLVAAYDDAAGVTAAFNRNALAVLNREVGTNFAVDAFAHRAVWVPDRSWIEMRLVATSAQTVTAAGLVEPLQLAAGDELRTEISAKFTIDGMTKELWEAGLGLDATWTGDDEQFALLVASPAP